MNRNKLFKIVTGLRVFDLGITYLILKRVGIEEEINGIIGFFLKTLGLEVGMILFFILSSGFLYGIIFLLEKLNKNLKLSFWLFVGIFNLVIIWNSLNLFSLIGFF